jgi:hypothetical protein
LTARPYSDDTTQKLTDFTHVSALDLPKMLGCVDLTDNVIGVICSNSHFLMMYSIVR